MRKRKIAPRLFMAIRYMADISGYAHMRSFKHVRMITKEEFSTYRNPIRVK